MDLIFRVRKSDASARLSDLKTKSGTLTLPEFFPVYNPNKPVVTPEEMKEMGIRALITNSYIIYKSGELRERALEQGIHSLLGFDGIVMTDSGAYQIYRYGDVEISNREILEFQHAIGSDIGSILDVPMSSEINRREAEKGVIRTLENAEEWSELRDNLKGTLWVGTPQGSIHTDLVEYSSRRIRELDFDYNGVGSLKVALERYDFTLQAKHFLLVRSILKSGKPFHFWGIGHPSTFAFFAALGADSFDSAAYALYAEQGRYMTPHGTLQLDDIDEFPCSCPVCMRYTPKEVKEFPREERVRLIAKHNLYVSIAEIRKVREAIKGEWLWELVQERARFHPKLYVALEYVLKNWKGLLEIREPFSKSSGLLYSGPETFFRPEVVRARDRVRNVVFGRHITRRLYGRVPLGLKYTYPFGQTVFPYEEDVMDEPSDEELVSSLLSYQFHPSLRELGEGVRIRRSKRTGMPREVMKDGVTLGFIRPSDGMFVPTLQGAEQMLKLLPSPRSRVCVKERFEETVARGTTVFVKFVDWADPQIRPKSEVLIVNSRDELLATGKAVLSGQEYRDFDENHPFILIRRHKLPREA